MDIKEAADKASTLLRIPSRFIASWWVSENGWNLPPTNNVGNISYTGSGLPERIGVFAGMTKVYPNDVVQYDTIASGINAFCLLLELPIEHKELTLDANMIRSASPNVRRMCEMVGQSNWAESHYQPRDVRGVPLPGSWEGENIFDVYYCRKMNELYGVLDKPESIAQPVSSPSVNTARDVNIHIVQAGETLYGISLRYRVPLDVIVTFNSIRNENVIQVGEHIAIPELYVVRSGDNLSTIAENHNTTVSLIQSMNHISNPNYIRVGQRLFV